MGSTEERFLTIINKLWESWNLRSCVVLSLCLHTLLLLSAPLRQRVRSRNYLHLLVWSAYLLADWIAIYGLGQTIQSPSDVYDSNSNPNKKIDLFVFWGQFFLLHLGGSDSITSFTPGDSSWSKQLTGVILQVVLTAYSFFLLVLAKGYKLWVPTILVFLAAVIKCFERVRSLVTASFDSLGEVLLPEPNPGPDYEEVVARITSTTSMLGATKAVQMRTEETNKMPANSEKSDREFDVVRLLDEAFSNFKAFKALFAGSCVSFEARERSRKLFLRLKGVEAFRLVELELGILHDHMHTKAATVHSRIGYFLRFICFSCVVCASISFFVVKKHGYDKFDTGLTYALLIATIFLDIISVSNLIFSQWSFINSPSSWRRNHIPAIILKQRRWSRSVFQYDMIRYCLQNRRGGVLYRFASSMFRGKGFVRMRITLFSYLVPVNKCLEEFIFNELKMKSENASDLKGAEEACSQRGISALLRSATSTPHSTELKWSFEEFHYMESLLLWHLATKLCCQIDQRDHHLSNTEDEHKRICKLLSDYVFYLLTTQPKMLSPDFGDWGVTFQDTQAEAERFMAKHKISHTVEACNKLISVETPDRSTVVKGDDSKSLLFDACILAKELIAMEEQRWKVTAKVWVELVCFAAINCPPEVHAQQPSRGGQLLTHIWLLMNHLGLGTQFSEKEREHAETEAPPNVSKGAETSET